MNRNFAKTFLLVFTIHLSNLSVAAENAQPIEILIPSATSAEVANEIITRMESKGWTVDLEVPDQIKISIHRPIESKELRESFCRDTKNCVVGHRLHYRLIPVGADVRLLLTSQLVEMPGTLDEKVADSTALMAKGLATNLEPLRNYFLAKAKPTAIDLEAKLNALPPQATKEKIVSLLGEPNEVLSVDDELTMIYLEQPTTGPHGEVSKNTRSQCIVRVVRGQLSEYACSSKAVTR